ncbi:protein-tyrosine phosphatase family protein [Providencia vermicola]|uniref:hypothetical protein n=1 Tax=Providencia vermicola TaxID=333965 RepID=UPI00220A9D2A|nr:hypothetical protein NFC79_14815 [Providencia stuartii]
MPSPISTSVRSLCSAISVKKSFVTFFQNLVGIKNQPTNNMTPATWYVPSAIPSAPINTKQIPIKDNQKVVVEEVEPIKPKAPPVEQFLNEIRQNKPQVVIVWSSAQQQEKTLFSEGVKEQQCGNLKTRSFKTAVTKCIGNLNLDCYNLTITHNNQQYSVPVMYVTNWSEEIKLQPNEKAGLTNRMFELMDQRSTLSSYPNRNNYQNQADKAAGGISQFAFGERVPKDLFDSIRVENKLGQSRV